MSTQLLPKPTQAQITERAYQIYLSNGAKEGHAVDDWLQAEYELLAQPVRTLSAAEPPQPRSMKRAAKSVVKVVKDALNSEAGRRYAVGAPLCAWSLSQWLG